MGFNVGLRNSLKQEEKSPRQKTIIINFLHPSHHMPLQNQHQVNWECRVSQHNVVPRPKGFGFQTGPRPQYCGGPGLKMQMKHSKCQEGGTDTKTSLTVTASGELYHSLLKGNLSILPLKIKRQ